MTFDSNLLMNALKRVPEPSLAFECSKSKSEKAIISRMAFNIEQYFIEKKQEHLYTLTEYNYEYFIDRNNKSIKDNNRADLAIVDTKDEKQCYLVLEAKQNYTFYCLNECNDLKKGINEDLERLNRIKDSIKATNVKKFFIQFLVHYATGKVHESIFAYGGGHNKGIAKTGSASKLIDEAEKKLSDYIDNDIKREFAISACVKERIKLGSYRNIPIVLSVFLLELT